MKYYSHTWKTLILLTTLLSYQPTTTTMQAKTDRLHNVARQVGLRINASKTQVLCVNSTPTRPVTIDGEPLEFVEEFTYLGSLISKDSGAGMDIKERLRVPSPNSLPSGDQYNIHGSQSRDFFLLWSPS